MKKIVSYALMFLLIASGITLGVSYAGNEEDKLNDINSKISQTQKQLNEGKKKEQQLNTQIKNLENQIKSVEKEIASIKGDIKKTEKNIDFTLQNLKVVEEEMALQNEGLNKRLRAMYKNGEIGLVEILLGSEDITDFMTNMDMVQKIFDNDVEVLKTMEEQHQKIQLQKKQLEALQAQLLAEKHAEAERQNTLQANRGQVAELKSQVASENQKLSKQIDTLNAEADRLIQEIRKLQGNGAYAGGKFAWPAVGITRVTSEFGYRIHPILKVKKLHTGIDFGAPTGTKIVAANSGTVIMAGWNNSYGYVVMIDHGGGIVTLYAHNSKLVVKTSDVVTKGQLVSYSGTTGMSTGPHLHFEVRINGQYENPRNWL